jgi:hypothetical protein
MQFSDIGVFQHNRFRAAVRCGYALYAKVRFGAFVGLASSELVNLTLSRRMRPAQRRS